MAASQNEKFTSGSHTWLLDSGYAPTGGQRSGQLRILKAWRGRRSIARTAEAITGAAILRPRKWEPAGCQAPMATIDGAAILRPRKSACTAMVWPATSCDQWGRDPETAEIRIPEF